MPSVHVLLVVDREDDVLGETIRQGLGNAEITVVVPRTNAKPVPAADVLLVEHAIFLHVRAKHPEILPAHIPMIVIRGASGEEHAVEAMRAGAMDYVPTSSHERLIPAIQRVLPARRTTESRPALSAAVSARFRQIIETAQTGIWTVDATGRTEYVNPQVALLVGRSVIELGAHAIANVLPNSANILAEVRQGLAQVEVREQRIVRPDGTILWVDLTAAPLLDEQGRLSEIVLTLRDVTERRRMMVKLLVSDRMVSVGTLAAGVAHEINNPLAVVVGNLTFALNEARKLDSALGPAFATLVEEPLVEAADAAQRIGMIVRDLKMFSRPGDGTSLAPLNVHVVLDSSLRMVTSELRHRARLIKDYRSKGMVSADEARLGQVFVNLILNAAQAIPEGDTDNHRVHVATRDDGDRVIVEIQDSGQGIPEAIVKRIFDPFFTTKPVGEGTGLGLSICYRTLTELGGTISVESEPGKGTTFTVAIPALQPLTRAAPQRSVASAKRRARVLIIDDELPVGKSIARTLADHEVHIVTLATDGLALLLAQRFDAVVCDLMMPQMNGIDLYEKLCEIAPTEARKLVFVTGGAFTPRGRQFLEQNQNPHLDKPIEPELLRAAILRVLA